MEIDGLIIRGALLPTPNEDTHPLERQNAYSGLGDRKIKRPFPPTASAHPMPPCCHPARCCPRLGSAPHAPRQRLASAGWVAGDGQPARLELLGGRLPGVAPGRLPRCRRYSNDSRRQTGDEHHPHRHDRCERGSRAFGTHHQPSTPGRQYHRLHQRRGGTRREAPGTAERGVPTHRAGRPPLG